MAQLIFSDMHTILAQKMVSAKPPEPSGAYTPLWPAPDSTSTL